MARDSMGGNAGYDSSIYNTGPLTRNHSVCAGIFFSINGDMTLRPCFVSPSRKLPEYTYRFLLLFYFRLKSWYNFANFRSGLTQQGLRVVSPLIKDNKLAQTLYYLRRI